MYRYGPSYGDTTVVVTTRTLGRIGNMNNEYKLPFAGYVASQALADYRECQSLHKWVSINDMYRLYHDHHYAIDYRMVMGDWPDFSLEPVHQQRFGAILRMLYPNALPCLRRVNKKMARGLAGITGPKSRQSSRIGGW